MSDDIKTRKPRKRAGIDYQPREIYLAAKDGMSLADACRKFDMLGMQLKLIALDFWTKNLKEFQQFGPPEFSSSRATGGNEISVTEAFAKYKSNGEWVPNPDGVTEDCPDGFARRSVGLRATIPNHVLEMVGATAEDSLSISVDKAQGTITLTLVNG